MDEMPGRDFCGWRATWQNAVTSMGNRKGVIFRLPVQGNAVEIIITSAIFLAVAPAIVSGKHTRPSPQMQAVIHALPSSF